MDFLPLATTSQLASSVAASAFMMEFFEHWFGPYPWYGRRLTILLEVPNTAWSTREPSAVWKLLSERLPQARFGHPASGSSGVSIICHDSGARRGGGNHHGKVQRRQWVQRELALTNAEVIYTDVSSGGAGAEYNVVNRRGFRNDRPIIRPTT